MRTTLRIPTGQYAFMEVEVEVESLEEAREKYLELETMIKSKGRGGLEPKIWNNALDQYLTENNLSSDDYANMSDIQKCVIQEIKKSLKRINKE